jgi:hypothetical protein
MIGALQPAGLSIKQFSLFEPRGRRFRPSSTDEMVDTSDSHPLTDTGETRAKVSRKNIFLSRTNMIKDAALAMFLNFISSKRFFHSLLSFPPQERLSRIIFLRARKKSSWVESDYYVMAQSCTEKLNEEQRNGVSSQ